MKTKSLLFIIIFFSSFSLYSQITISNNEVIVKDIFTKPSSYDSLRNWGYEKQLADYKKYIGLQIYLHHLNVDIEDKNRFFSIVPTIVKRKIEYGSYDNLKTFDTLATFTYKPIIDYYFGGNGYKSFHLCSDSTEMNNTYFTIIDIIYGNKFDSIEIEMNNKIKSLQKNNNFYINGGYNFKRLSNTIPCLFLLRNSKNNDLVYYYFDNSQMFYDENTNDMRLLHFQTQFTLVPYYVKTKQLYQNKNMIWVGNNCTMTDPRIIENYEDEYGQINHREKKVEVKSDSKWKCVDVTLIKPTYQIYYVFKNDQNEQIAITYLSYFYREIDYIKKENDRKLQRQQLLAKEKQDKLLKEESERKALAKRRIDCVSKFGKSNGELIAERKVKINMTTQMCKYSWGDPFWTSKTITEFGVYENWYYSLGCCLYFENGLLKRIDE